MSHWAEVEEVEGKLIVKRVLIGDNNAPDEGESFMNSLGGRWIKTSYNTVGGVHSLGGTPFRKNYAGKGFEYDVERDAFIPPKPFPSWVLNEQSCLWEAPVARPEGDTLYVWDEETVSWVERSIPETTVES